MIYQGTPTYYNSDIAHFGVKGMKWGVRRYQNPDGSLTKKGKKRYDHYNKKYHNGSSHAIVGLALDNQASVFKSAGLKKLADIEYNRADAKMNKWAKKRDSVFNASTESFDNLAKSKKHNNTISRGKNYIRKVYTQNRNEIDTAVNAAYYLLLSDQGGVS